MQIQRSRWVLAFVVLSAFVARADDFGVPLPGLDADHLAAFTAGKAHFQQAEGPDEGLGPVFNEASCVTCHFQGGVGGDSNRVETRFGRVDNGLFDPLSSRGGSLLQDHAIGLVNGTLFVPEVVPPEANVVAGRKTTPLFGLGLVDAVPGSTLRALAFFQLLFTPAQAGRAANITDLATGNEAVGRFGFKDQVASLAVFAGDAYLNEMGITTPLFPQENCPQGDCALLAANPVPGINDATGEDAQAFTDFMTQLAAPARGPQSLGTALGQGVFTAIGCAVCHTDTLVTGNHANPALDRKVFHPYSDFLLHDMGSLGDGIAQGVAGPREMRTTPLWGLRVRTRFLHDARTDSLDEAIRAHDGQGADAKAAFQALDPLSRRFLLAFLRSL